MIFLSVRTMALVAAEFHAAESANCRRVTSAKVTAHPTAAWTLQQFREAIPSDHTYRFLIDDRDPIFSAEVDDELGAFGLKVLRTPDQAPKANAYCERLIGTIRRECLDYVIPLSEKHLRTILREWLPTTIRDDLSLPGSPFSLKALNLR